MLPLLDGLRIVGRSLRVRLKGFHQYEGDAKQICSRIVDECWNGRYFQTSTGHFSGFWTRDFGWCVDALLTLGYRKEVLQTLAYALERFSRANKVTTTITPDGTTFDFARFAPDSLPFLVHALSAARAKRLVDEHHDFLRKEAERYKRIVLVPKTCRVRPVMFSSMRDGVYRQSSSYDTAMMGMLSAGLARLGIAHTLPATNAIKRFLMSNYWNGSYFLDDLSGSQHVAGDAQVFPFWTRVVRNKRMMRQAFAAVHRAGLDTPFPLKYVAQPRDSDQLEQRIFAPNYEGNTIWAHMGLLYIQLLKDIDPKRAEQHIKRYAAQVEKHKTFLELYQPDGRAPYSSMFYAADEGMLWAANLQVLL